MAAHCGSAASRPPRTSPESSPTLTGLSACLADTGAVVLDYATAGPNLPIQMAAKDAVFLSLHKFVGGPSTPGVLVAKRALFRNRVPSVPWRRIFSVRQPGKPGLRSGPWRPRGRRHTRNRGVDSRRAGVRAGRRRSALRRSLGVSGRFARRALRPGAAIRGSRSSATPPPIGCRSSRWNTAPAAVLAFELRGRVAQRSIRDLQASGCFCAGPYLHRLYGVDRDWSTRMEAECLRGNVGAKLGFVRVGFNYFTGDEVFGYIVEAIHFVRRSRMEAAAALPVRPGEWPVRDHRAPTGAHPCRCPRYPAR